MGRRRRRKQTRKAVTPVASAGSEFQTPMVGLDAEDALTTSNLTQLNLKSITYGCCFYNNDADRIPHILTHYVGGTVTTLREHLTKFVNSNVYWINEVCGDALNSRNIRLDSFLNDIVEPGYVFDEIAIMVVAMMSGKHAFIVCKNRYWTTRASSEYSNCPIQLAFFGDGVFKEVVPFKPEYVEASAESLLDKQPQSEQMDTTEDPFGPPLNAEHSDIDADLDGTGILPIDKENTQEHQDSSMPDAPNETEQKDLQNEPEKITNKEDDMHVNGNEVHVDATDSTPAVDIQVDSDVKGNVEGIHKHPKQLIVLLDKYSAIEKQEKHDEHITSEEEQDSADASANDSGIESDGWVPEDVERKTRRRIKKQTKTIDTAEGTLSVRTVGRVKRVPRQRQHRCHICQETFEMQCNFTKHYATAHPDQPFQCEYCQAVLQTPNGLFKHERSHLYLKHQCAECGKRFQFPRQKEHHMKIHTGEGLYPCLHCDRKFTLNSTMLIHSKTHTTRLPCDLCPKHSEKRYNSAYALDIHQQGMHRGGWNSFCGKNFKWKSKYTRHVKKCDPCKAEKLRLKKLRHTFDT